MFGGFYFWFGKISGFSINKTLEKFIFELHSSELIWLFSTTFL
jgi:heme/copper-type cytochrome/quinol oxidase subunit 1